MLAGYLAALGALLDLLRALAGHVDLSFGGSPVGNGSKTPNGVKSQGLFRASRRILRPEYDPVVSGVGLVMIVLVVENAIRDPVGEGGTRSIPLVVRAFFA